MLAISKLIDIYAFLYFIQLFFQKINMLNKYNPLILFKINYLKIAI